MRFAHFILLSLNTGLLFGVAIQLDTIVANRYAAHGMWWTIVHLCVSSATTCGLYAVLASLAAEFFRAVLPAQRSPVRSTTAVALSIVLSLIAIALGLVWKRLAVLVALWCVWLVVSERYRRRFKKTRAFLAGNLAVFVLLVSVYAVNAPRPLSQQLYPESLAENGGILLTALVFFALLHRHFDATHRHIGLGASVARLAFTGLIFPLLFWSQSPWVRALQTQPRNPMNVILIAVDTLRFDHTSLGAQRPGTRDFTPNLRAWAERGVVFQSAISQAPWTLPAFASVMTGKYPQEHGAISMRGLLSPGHVTLAEIFREAGYMTGAVVSHEYVDSRHGFSQGFEWFNDSPEIVYNPPSSRRVSDGALDFLNAQGNAPFFLFTHYFDPHYVFQNHVDWGYADDYTGWLAKDRSLVEIETLRDNQDRLSEEDLAYLLNLYDEEIAFTDAQIGRVLQWVSDAGLADDTAIVFIADHGEEFMDHGRIGHTVTLYDELIHVPMFCVLPGIEARSDPVSDVVETRGIFQMLLDYTGLSGDPTSRMLAKITAQNRETEDAFSVVWLPDAPADSGKQVRISSLRTRQWKLIHDHVANKRTLFDLTTDPAEKRNVADSHPTPLAELGSRLDAWMARMNRKASPVRRLQLTPEEEQNLEALGYL